MLTGEMANRFNILFNKTLRVSWPQNGLLVCSQQSVFVISSFLAFEVLNEEVKNQERVQ